jgi:hypothetical protein
VHVLTRGNPSRLELLRTPAKIIAAIRRLEELQCLNTAEVVILWAWTAGVVNPADHDAWGLIERYTQVLSNPWNGTPHHLVTTYH